MAVQLNCPQCENMDKVQKVSSLYTGGISTVEYEAWVPPSPKTDLPPLLRTHQGVSQSVLSRKLTPPAEPTPEGTSGCIWFIGIAMVVGAMEGFYSISIHPEWSPRRVNQDLVPSVIALILGIVILVAMFYVRDRRHKEAAARMPAWEKAIRKWNQLCLLAVGLEVAIAIA